MPSTSIPPPATTFPDGFAVEHGWIHLPDSTLLATTRHTRLAG